MSGKPTLEVTTDVNGSPTVRLTGKGFVLTQEEAESIVKLVADLRELCADMWPIARSGVCIDRCAHYGECIKQYDERGCMLKQKMDELGIPH